jgi:putative addiction module component (TIGR02574 family)
MSILSRLGREALTLTPEERVRLADRLLSSVSGASDVDAAWASEIEQRIARVEEGRGVYLTPEEVADHVRRALEPLTYGSSPRRETN